ncbi:hypothetical protein D3C77_658060 [compost metagenome]
MMVTPWRFSSVMKFHIERRSSMSTPAVGSSRISRRGWWISARAIISRRFMPPESMREGTLRLSHKPSWVRYCSARSLATRMGMP